MSEDPGPESFEVTKFTAVQMKKNIHMQISLLYSSWQEIEMPFKSSIYTSNTDI